MIDLPIHSNENEIFCESVLSRMGKGWVEGFLIKKNQLLVSMHSL